MALPTVSEFILMNFETAVAKHYPAPFLISRSFYKPKMVLDDDFVTLKVIANKINHDYRKSKHISPVTSESPFGKRLGKRKVCRSGYSDFVRHRQIGG